jgi:hypothetical protein
LQQRSFAGITFKDTYFIQTGEASESLHFHELVHVAQWKVLGVDNFLRAYGAGLVMYGYEDSPLEKMAYSLQREFDEGRQHQDLLATIEARTQAIWTQVAPVFGLKS